MSQINQTRKIKNKKSIKHCEARKKRKESESYLDNSPESNENILDFDSPIKQSDKDLVSENPSEETSPYKQLLNSSIRENAKRIRKEFIGIEHSANQYLAYLNQIVSDYVLISSQLQSTSNYYLNYIFSSFGYKYQSEIKGINFFHFAAESWIIEVFKSICSKYPCTKRKSKNEKLTKDNTSFFEILNEIYNTKVREASFLKNLELITGTIYFDDGAVKLTGMRLGKYFLDSINSNIEDLRNEFIPDTLSKEDFENKLMEILSKSVESTLNLLENLGEGKNSESADYIQYYHKLQTLLDYNLESSLKEYVKLLLEDSVLFKEKRLSDDIIFMKSAELFYNFASCKLNVLLDDLFVFNRHSTSFFYKVIFLILKNKEEFISLFSLMYNTFLETCKNTKKKIDFGSISLYSWLFGDMLNNLKLSNLFSLTQDRSINCLIWIKDVCNHKLKMYPKIVLDNFAKVPPLLNIYDKIYSPTKDFTIAFTFKTISLIFKIPSNLILNVGNMLRKILELVRKNYSFFKDNMFLQKLININYEKDRDLFIIIISRKLQFLESNCFKNLIEKIYQLFSLKRMRDNTIGLYEKVKENSVCIKETLLDKYKRIFSGLSHDKIF